MTEQQRQPGDVIYRDASIEKIEPKEHRVDLSFTSETDRVTMWGVPEVLLHERSAVDFSHLEQAGSVLYDHDPKSVIGAPSKVWLDEGDRKCRAIVAFDPDDPEALKVWNKIERKVIRGVSAGIKVTEWRNLYEDETWTSPGGKEFKGPIRIAAQWTPFEISVTPIPADASVGIGRSVVASQNASAERSTMAKKADTPDPEITTPAASNTEPKKEAQGSETLERKITPDAETLKRDMLERRDAIISMCRSFKETESLETELLTSNLSVEDCRTRCYEHLRSTRTASRIETNVPPQRAIIERGEEAHDKFSGVARDWLQAHTKWGRAELDERRMSAVRELGCYRLLDLAREDLRSRGIKVVGMTPDDLVEATFRYRAMSHTSSDFPKLFENIATKSLLKAYEATPATWRQFCRVVSVPDFKEASAVRLGDSGLLEETPDGAPMPEMSMAENREKYAVKTYARRFGLTRQTMINDDLSALERIPQQMGNAVQRTINKLFYDLLVSASGVGPTMTEDSLALFSATHTSGANYTAAAFAIDVANLGAAKKLMRRQKGLVAAGETAPILNIQPTYLLVPAALENLALQIVTQVTPAEAAKVTPAWIRSLQVVVEASLDDATNGTTAWYLVGDPGQWDGAWMAFLNGVETPQTREVVGTNILGVQWDVYMDFGVKFVDHRGWYRARGA